MTKLPAHSLLVAGALLCATPAAAAPAVVASIKPVHSLVASVMQGVGSPDLLVDGAASPHTYAMKPSDATALSEADIVFWVGEPLETFLEHPLQTLAEDATVVSLLHADGLVLHDFRPGGAFEHGDEAGHDEHDVHEDEHATDEDHDHHADADGHDEDGHASGEGGAHDAHGHSHTGTDPHVWLDPENAAAMVDAIAATLAEADPENADRYAGNAERTKTDLAALDDEIAGLLAPVADAPFIVFHDGYQYFQRHYGLNIAGTITVSPDQAPGAARVREIQAEIREAGAACVFAEPQFAPQIVATVTEGTDARSGTLDPLGAGLDAGPGLYDALLREMAGSAARCLSGQG